jgi:transposase
MFDELSQMQLSVKPGATDMRKQSAGLAAVVQEKMALDPFSKSLFIFCNRKRNLIKAAYSFSALCL